MFVCTYEFNKKEWGMCVKTWSTKTNYFVGLLGRSYWNCFVQTFQPLSLWDHLVVVLTFYVRYVILLCRSDESKKSDDVRLLVPPLHSLPPPTHDGFRNRPTPPRTQRVLPFGNQRVREEWRGETGGEGVCVSSSRTLYDGGRSFSLYQVRLTLPC